MQQFNSGTYSLNFLPENEYIIYIHEYSHIITILKELKIKMNKYVTAKI